VIVSASSRTMMARLGSLLLIASALAGACQQDENVKWLNMSEEVCRMLAPVQRPALACVTRRHAVHSTAA
jgi:hypothetical protein